MLQDLWYTLRVAALLVALAVLDVQGAQRTPSIKDVMRRVAAYVQSYGERASIVVATERYTQEARTDTSIDPKRRRLLADFAIVKVDSLRGWQGFRDVVEVDGERIGDRDDRLVRLLMESSGRFDEARRLSDESARFNIGAIYRNFNVPTTVLFFFTPDNVDRFKFKANGVDKNGAWEIEFRETSTPTLIRTPAGRSIPSQGRIWVDPADGTVLRTIIEVQGFGDSERSDAHGTGRVDVSYQHVSALGMWLPVTMDEEFEARRGGAKDRISGHALYTNYRQFTTSARIK